MTDKKITELTTYTPPINADLMPIVDFTTLTTKKISWVNIKAALKTYFDSLSTTLTNKTLTSPVLNTGISGTAITTGAEVTAGTNNTKIVTPKAIGDALVWTAYTPTITPYGALTYTGLTHSSKYTSIGKICIFILSVSGTLGGTTSNAIEFSLPINTALAALALGASGLYANGGNHYSTTMRNYLSDQTLTVWKYDASSYALAALQVFEGVIIYPI